MSILKIKKTTRYTIRWGFVDNTYWDDGNRYTSRQKAFTSFTKACEFYGEKLSSGTTYECSHVSGKSAHFNIGWIQFFREITDNLTPSENLLLESYNE